MIAWWWVLVALFIGKLIGISVMAILFGSWSHKEEAEIKNRQRGNADGSKGGVL